MEAPASDQLPALPHRLQHIRLRESTSAVVLYSGLSLGLQTPRDRFRSVFVTLILQNALGYVTDYNYDCTLQLSPKSCVE